MNSPASVRARLLNLSQRSGEDFQSVLTRYAIERFLYRVGISEQRHAFVLKGAMLFVAWQGCLHRPTKDLDLLGFGAPSVADVAARIRQIAAVSVEDGIVFDSDGVETEVIAEEATYAGVRAKLTARLEQARIRLQVDVGFGDAVQPEPLTREFPALLPHMAAPVLRMYPAEVVIAEKLHAMLILDIRNSRMKDFYDIWYLAQTGSFQASTLRGALEATFARRQTDLPTAVPFALTGGFLGDEAKSQQWQAFLRRLRLDADTPDLLTVGTLIARFLEPVLREPAGTFFWQPGGPWRDSRE